MSAIFEEALAFALEWEGGYVNHPNDRGGSTNKGITQATYDRWNRSIGNPQLDVRNITDREVRDIYRVFYWESAHCYRMTRPLAIVMFDTSVNFGCGGAIQFMQDALSVRADGSWGPKTDRAFQSSDQNAIAVKICDLRYQYRLDRVYRDRSQSVFLAGWHNRDKALKQFITGGTMIHQVLRANVDTVLKRRPLQSRDLPQNELIQVLSGNTIECRILREEQGHQLVELRTARRGFFNWYIFPPHWGNSAPQQSQTIDWNNPRQLVSRYFTVGEVTQNDTRRIPTDQCIIRNILRLAQELDRVRDAWGRPIGVTSWYRPPAINARVGGVRNSTHIQGMAADIYPSGGDIWQFERWLDGVWGDRALGYGANRGFVHVDLRAGRIRWNY